MNEWTQLLTGSGITGAPILVLVLTGKLIPSWVVNRQVAALERQQSAAIAALEASHTRELQALLASQKDVLEVRDREADRLGESLGYEREAKDVERNRSDTLAQRLADLAGEYGAVGLKFQRAIQEAASSER